MCARYWLLKAKRLTLERRVILEGHGGDGGRGCDRRSSEYVAELISPSRDHDRLCDKGGVRDV
jgi:hypothetical protein